MPTHKTIVSPHADLSPHAHRLRALYKRLCAASARLALDGHGNNPLQGEIALCAEALDEACGRRGPDVLLLPDA